MAVAIFKPSMICKCSTTFQILPFLLYSSQKLSVPTSLSSVARWSSAVAAMDTVDETQFVIEPTKSRNPGGFKVREWRKLSSKELGVSTSMISIPAKVVLKELKKNGHHVYLVGGCVRDLILKRIPKDFDVLTSAELREVIKAFPHAEIVGRRFPICHVHIGDHIVEVSSFSTGQRRSNRNLSFAFEVPVGCDEKDDIRWRNCMQRDFTINGLMFDPFARLVYDYTGGLEDIRKAKLRTIIPASTSFHEDSARILRAIRIAARLGFRFARETAQSIRNLAYSIMRLDKARLLMEMNYMLAYGSAQASLRLLWKFGLLDILLPHQAAYLVHCGFGRRDNGSNMLLALFANLDKLLGPDRPCDSNLWVAILAFHKALSDRARAPSVVAAFALAINNGGDLAEAVDIAKIISRPSEQSFHELLEPRDFEKTALKVEVLGLAASVNRALSSMTDQNAVSNAMVKYPQAPHSDLVFIPLGLYLRVCRMIGCVHKGKEIGVLSKQGGKIDFEKLAFGSLQEVRHVFARVVFDTLYPVSCVGDHITL